MNGTAMQPNYVAFLASKAASATLRGLASVPELSSHLFPFQILCKSWRLQLIIFIACFVYAVPALAEIVDEPFWFATRFIEETNNIPTESCNSLFLADLIEIFRGAPYSDVSKNMLTPILKAHMRNSSKGGAVTSFGPDGMRNACGIPLHKKEILWWRISGEQPIDASGYLRICISNIFPLGDDANSIWGVIQRNFVNSDIWPLSNNIVVIHQTDLNGCKCGRNTGNNESKYGNWRSPPIILLFMGIVFAGCGWRLLDHHHRPIFGMLCVILSGGLVFWGTLWLGLILTETANASSDCDVSATRYSRTENVRVIPIVVSELKLGDVEWQIFAAHFVEAAHDAALQKRPKPSDNRHLEAQDRQGDLFQADDEYDGETDFARSLDVGYAAIRERMAKGGGAGWT